MKKDSYLQKGITLAGLFILLSAYIYWAFTVKDKGFDYYLVAFVNCALSFGVFMQFAKKVPEVFEKSEIVDKTSAKVKIKTVVLILLSGVATVAVVMAVAHLLLKILGLDNSLDFWLCTDSSHYIDIARDWYLSEGTIHRIVQLVFLPGYPVVVRLLNYVVDNFLVSGLIVSWCAFLAAAVVLYKLLLLDYDEKTSMRAVKYLFICPAVFFYVAPMSDSLFLLLSLLCLYFVRKGKLWTGCLIGACASFTRSLGITLMVPVFFEVVDKLFNEEKITVKKCVGKIFPILSISLGLLAYFYVNYDVSGNPFQFMIYQSEHWGQNFGFYFSSAAKKYSLIRKCFVEYYPDALCGKVIPNLCSLFLPLIMMIFTVKKMRCSYSAWFIVYFLISLGTTALLSGPRYMMSCFPLFISFSLITENKKADTVLSVLSVMLFFVYMFAFVQRWGVW